VTAIDLPLPLSPGTDLPIAFGSAVLDTPAILVDLDIVEANIDRMARFAARNGFALRPHIKTHKSAALARRQVGAGAVGICTATVSEAKAMIEGGVRDVLIAYPLVGKRKFERLSSVMELADVTLAADSEAVIQSYIEFAEHVGRVIPVLVEVDTGMHRVGVAPERAVVLANMIAKSHVLEFRGIMTHAGQVHDVTAALDIAAVARQEATTMGAVRQDIERTGLDVQVISAGSTITAAYFRPEDGITEIRPGTYIYNDLRTLGLFACAPDALAVTALATIVSVDNSRMTIDAGSKTLTVTRDSAFGYGLLVEDNAVKFTRLSEEHGVLSLSTATERFRVGQRIRVVPVHVCVWMDLQAEVYGIRGSQIVERIEVDAMRHSL
jgi:D-serine deaminase-like pyridoxal phosphate-dependent protein